MWCCVIENTKTLHPLWGLVFLPDQRTKGPKDRDELLDEFLLKDVLNFSSTIILVASALLPEYYFVTFLLKDVVIPVELLSVVVLGICVLLTLLIVPVLLLFIN